MSAVESCIHDGPAICARTIAGPGDEFSFGAWEGVACVAVIGTCWRTTSLVPIPVGVATTVLPTNGWVGFGQSEHGELPTYGTLFKILQNKWKRYLTISLSPRLCQ